VFKPLILFITALTAGAVWANPPTPSLAAQRGLAIASQRCVHCHALGANVASPNPEAPPLVDVANHPGVTTKTLRRFLTDSHNFPEAMGFALDRKAAKDLSAYLLTLKSKDYRPEI
jgi:mono/diheme cytochrome c family protein